MTFSVKRRVQVFHNLLQRHNLLPDNLLQMSEYSLQPGFYSLRDNFIIGNAFSLKNRSVTPIYINYAIVTWIPTIHYTVHHISFVYQCLKGSP